MTETGIEKKTNKQTEKIVTQSTKVENEMIGTTFHFLENKRLSDSLSSDGIGYVPVKSKLEHSPPPGIWRLFLPGREGIW